MMQIHPEVRSVRYLFILVKAKKKCESYSLQSRLSFDRIRPAELDCNEPVQELWDTMGGIWTIHAFQEDSEFADLNSLKCAGARTDSRALQRTRLCTLPSILLQVFIASVEHSILGGISQAAVRNFLISRVGSMGWHLG